MIGPTLQDIMHVTDSSYSSISNAMSMRGAGLVAGSALGIYLTPNLSRSASRKWVSLSVLITIGSWILPEVMNEGGVFISISLKLRKNDEATRYLAVMNNEHCNSNINHD